MRVELQIPPPVVLFYSVIYSKSHFKEQEIISLLATNGPFQVLNPTHNPSVEYYSKEMGKELARVILSSLTLVQRDSLAEFKLEAIDLEKKFSKNQLRTINIDPGFLSLENMILATSKPYAHRVSIGKGVYADLNYIYSRGTYNATPWTYPDYLCEEKLSYFHKIREHLKSEISIRARNFCDHQIK
jgi:hypothetical protein